MAERIVTHGELLAPYRDREYNRARAASQAFYRSARWRHVRAFILNRDPICTVCGRQVATEVDHVVDRSDAPDRELDPSNLNGKCKKCHSRKTAQTMHARCPGGPTVIHRLR